MPVDQPRHESVSLWDHKPWWCQPWSILLTGVAVVLGGRAGERAIRHGCDTAEIEAQFDDVRDPGVLQLLTDAGIAADDGIAFDREDRGGSRERNFDRGSSRYESEQRSFGGSDEARVEKVQREWKRLGQRRPTPGEWQGLLSQHALLNPFDGSCVHAPMFDYGTRSSALWLRANEAAESELYWLEGRPCEAKLEAIDWRAGRPA